VCVCVCVCVCMRVCNEQKFHAFFREKLFEYTLFLG
jgi:hypothetical protein